VAARRLAVIAWATQANGLLPIRGAEVAALLRRVPFGAKLAGRDDLDCIDGFALTLSVPYWLNEALGGKVAAPLVTEIQLIEAHLLVYLQFLDDELDRQTQMGAGDSQAPLDAARERLLRLFERSDPFWATYAALADEQRASARWEIESRFAPSPPFDDELFRRLANKAALLRWPAAALARLAGRPEDASRLDDLFGRLLGVFLLLDDLEDFEEDAGRGQINAVLCAGGVRSRDPLHFYASVLRGTAAVCAKGRRELAALRRACPQGSFQRTCEYLEQGFADRENAVPRRCRARIASHLFGQLAAH